MFTIISSINIKLYHQWILEQFARSPIATTGLLIFIIYLLWNISIKIRKRSEIMEKFNKLPGLVGSSIYGYLLGDIEVYYRYMWHLKREKGNY